MFESLLDKVDSEIAKRIYRVQPMGVEPRPIKHIETVSGKDSSVILSEESATSEGSSPERAIKNSDSAGFAGAFKKIAMNRPSGAPVRNDRKIGRNDPCWCGSGKKYKRCHYPN